ncbi:hypothetical protein [Marinibactrum halimedae]|uniref:Uncharacterized protein n=1 Tax=Marinibactrum halimedae TaxID=1444977 RepID=A0AA37WMW9_9GAMM|nr:hypothetical protein [Marinibactrum halimedae]MCD9459419.1 hypothetical protein [Marinibactrum halimedae]GLS27514.1 hypothetical protein GCM10007877_32330 [Marinibactrum halimedae]
MLFKKARSRRSSILVSFVAGLGFIGLAVYGWGMPIEKVGSFALISLLLLLGLVLLGGCGAMMLIGIRKIFGPKDL